MASRVSRRAFVLNGPALPGGDGMHPRLAAVVEFADRARTELLVTVDAVPEPLREARPSEAAWSVAEILEHLMMVERSVAKLVALKGGELQSQAQPPREAPEMVPVDLSRFMTDRSTRIDAPERVVPRGELSAAESLAALLQTRGMLLDQLHTVDGLALSAVSHPHPLFGPLDLYEWIQMIGWHELRHAEQIREVAAQLDTP
jgi:hypothetical protein